MYDQEGHYTIALPRLYVDGQIEVVRKSPRKYRDAVERFACYFRREFDFDFRQFEARERSDDYVAYLLYAHDVHCGACCFRRREYRNAPEVHWGLQWIWIHPYRRRKGILKNAWLSFAKFRPFYVEPPQSAAMAGFLTKYNDGGTIVK